MRISVSDVLLGTRTFESHLVIGLSELLQKYRLPRDVGVLVIAKHLKMLADGEPDNSFDPAASLYEEAAKWFRIDDPEQGHECSLRVAELFEAKARVAAALEDGKEMMAGIELEKAIAKYKSLPRKFKKVRNIDERIKKLGRDLEEARFNTLDEMVMTKTKSFDYTNEADAVRRHVSGRPLLEALAVLACIESLSDPVKARAEAVDARADSITALFSRTTYSEDGRKIAASGGRSVEDEEEAGLWSEIQIDSL